MDRRRGRLVFSHHPQVAWRWVPWLLSTATVATTPWVWRLYWGSCCLGLLKSDWDKPTRLTRQLRRQIERGGRLVIAAAVLVLASLVCPVSSHAEDWCYTPDAILAQAILKYKWRVHSAFEPGQEGELFVRAQGQGSCTQTPEGVEMTARLLEERVARNEMRREVRDAVMDAVIITHSYRYLPYTWWSR